MNNKEDYESLLYFAKAYSDALEPLNTELMNYFSNEYLKGTMASLEEYLGIASESYSKVKQQLISIATIYSKRLEEIGLSKEIGEPLRNAFSNLQVEAMFSISQAVQTEMIKELAACFANAKYDKLSGVINRAIGEVCIGASDIAFLKTSNITTVLSEELQYPRGVISTLNNLNKTTANDIIKNSFLMYDTRKNVFVSSEGEINSKGLNIVCSGRELFSKEMDELFSDEELIDFISSLSRMPMQARSKEVGQRIYQLILELYQNNEKTIGFDKEVYYHCRTRKADEMPYTTDLMLKAPIGKTGAGRYNHPGRANYYFADTLVGAEAEVSKHKKKEDIIQNVELTPIREARLLDLSGSLARGKTFLRYLRFAVSDNSIIIPREYLLPCYVAECCEDIGFEGIKYYGSMEYNNYVTWKDGYFELAVGKKY